MMFLITLRMHSTAIQQMGLNVTLETTTSAIYLMQQTVELQ